jgi:hypothetical protein
MKAWIASAAMAATLAAGAAQAGDVSWSVTVGSPRPAPHVIYAPPPVVYAPPPVVYHPAPVVYRPAPVMLAPPPMMRLPPPMMLAQPPMMYAPMPARVVYGPPVYHMPPGHAKHWKKDGHRHPGAVVYAQPRGYYRN